MIRRVGRLILDVLLPPACLACGTAVDEPGALCPVCWGKVAFIAAPACACCGLPFGIEAGEGALCASCLAEPPPFARARAVFLYDDGSKPLVLRFKHGDRTDAAPAFGRWMARAGADLLAEAEAILPVPLHRWRLFRRRYNQAALLAHELARLSGVPAQVLALRRARRTPPQGQMSREARRRNVRGAFLLADPAAVAGRRVLLVDDVLTSGATVGECARVLLAGGATAVDVLTLARVGRVEG